MPTTGRNTSRATSPLWTDKSVNYVLRYCRGMLICFRYTMETRAVCAQVLFHWNMYKSWWCWKKGTTLFWRLLPRWWWAFTLPWQTLDGGGTDHTTAAFGEFGSRQRTIPNMAPNNLSWVRWGWLNWNCAGACVMALKSSGTNSATCADRKLA